jgi:hypothetical protein
MSEKSDKMVAGLRELADFFEERPELCEVGTVSATTFYVFTYSPEQFAEAVRLLGKGAKSAHGDWFNVTRQFGIIDLQVTAQRDNLCERVQTGTKVVKARDPQLVREALEDIPEVETEEPVFEWSCPESVLAFTKL